MSGALPLIPQVIRIACYDVSVRRMTEYEQASHDEQGAFLPATNEIILNFKQLYSIDNVIEVLFHEILHAVNRACDVQDSTTEEDHVTRVTPMFLAVLKNNPELRNLLEDWLSK